MVTSGRDAEMIATINPTLYGKWEEEASLIPWPVYNATGVCQPAALANTCSLVMEFELLNWDDPLLLCTWCVLWMTSLWFPVWARQLELDTGTAQRPGKFNYTVHILIHSAFQVEPHFFVWHWSHSGLQQSARPHLPASEGGETFRLLQRLECVAWRIVASPGL